jgi:hypothetical protein
MPPGFQPLVHSIDRFQNSSIVEMVRAPSLEDLRKSLLL